MLSALNAAAAPPAPQKAPAQKAQPEKPQPSQDTSGSGLPVWVGVGGSIAVAVGAFVANGKNQTDVRAAEQQAQEAAQEAAKSTAEVAKGGSGFFWFSPIAPPADIDIILEDPPAVAWDSKKFSTDRQHSNVSNELIKQLLKAIWGYEASATASAA